MAEQLFKENGHKSFSQLSEQAKWAIKRDKNEIMMKKRGENGTSVTGNTIRTNDIDLDKLSESGRQKLAARMGPTRGEWDRSEFASSSVTGGSVTHSHQPSQVGFGDMSRSPQMQGAPSISALRTRGQRAPSNLGGGTLADGFRPAPKAPTATGGFVPGSKAPTVISATTTVVRDPSLKQGRSTTALSPRDVGDASQLGTGSLEQTNKQFKELIDEMAALQQAMSLNEQRQRWLFFNVQKPRKEKGEGKN